MNTEKTGLNRKLAEWAGFKLIDTQFYEHSFGNSEVESWDDPNGKDCGCYVPNFTQSLDASFKWLWRKAIKILAATEREGCEKLLGLWLEEPGQPITPLGLCLTIEELIDKEVLNV